MPPLRDESAGASRQAVGSRETRGRLAVARSLEKNPFEIGVMVATLSRYQRDDWNPIDFGVILRGCEVSLVDAGASR